ncbi:MAG: hypothetical protein HN368_13950 [Spirochaetales bacterium]|nr:hypothetical protein [Spirochaetales bacterium]
MEDFITPNSDAETHIKIAIRCRNGTLIDLERGEYMISAAENSWEIIGETASLTLRMTTGEKQTVVIHEHDPAEGVQERIIWQGDEDGSTVHAGPVSDFCAAIREKREPKTTLEKSMILQRITDAAYASASSGTSEKY